MNNTDSTGSQEMDLALNEMDVNENLAQYLQRVNEKFFVERTSDAIILTRKKAA